MNEKLDSLTELLHRHDAHCREHHSPARQRAGSNQTVCFTGNNHTSPLATSLDLDGTSLPSPPFFDTGHVYEELSLSHRHSTASQYLLTWECSPLRLSQSELQYPLELELRRPKLSRSTAPPDRFGPSPPGTCWASRLSMSELSRLTQAYFGHFHPSCLVLDEAWFYGHTLNNVLKSNFSEGLDTCVVLLVLALGAVTAANTGHDEWAQFGDDENGRTDDSGLGLFNMAADMLRDVEGADWESVQCLLLTGWVPALLSLVPSGLIFVLVSNVCTAYSTRPNSECTTHGK